MAWAYLLFLVPLVFFALVVRRFVRIALLLRDPAKFRAMLSEPVRAALDEANVPPDALDFSQIENSEELQRLVVADVRRIFGSALFSFAPTTEVTTTAATSRDPATVQMPTPLFELRGSSPDPSEGLDLPPPIDAEPGSAGRGAVLLAIVALVALAIYLVNSSH